MAFDEESTSQQQKKRSHFMSSIAKTTTRSKKTRRLGAVRVIRPEQHEAFDVNNKVDVSGPHPLGSDAD